MAEANTSATGATGNDAGTAGGNTGAAGGTAAATGTTGAAAAVWTDTIADAELKDWSVNKGYNKYDPAAAAPLIAQQYRSLEKLVGAEKAGRTVEIPDWEKSDANSQRAFFERIGAPKEAKDYDLAIPKEAKIDPEFETWARTNFHAAGLTAKQANAVGKAWNDFAVAQVAKQTTEDNNRFATEDKALKTEWGAAYDDKLALASAAAKSLGIKGEALDALQKVAGYGDVMRTFANIASKIGEDQFVGGEGGNTGGTMTPEEAGNALKAHQNDKDWMAAWMDKSNPKHKEAVARKSYLTSLMAGIKPETK